ncbi:low-density lipoprotein receptor class A domain-containing protein 1 isoform X1 [Ursus americanus]|uniref:low-density lipoprotein receptor class A domain-containing protein 1 isoform X1 n=1 Tax=Ursus americanus TaxID=9643 RepID=UPI001E679F94|nr:low-density lipoprotein receptor class A domain-containing protein 1 isoform X1 [Ursus americanus]
MNKIFPQGDGNDNAAGAKALPGGEGCGPLCCSRQGACLSAFLLLLLVTLAALIALVAILGLPPRTPGAQTCVTATNRTGFLCHDRRSCIPASRVCDGVRTCAHGEDEDEAMCRVCCTAPQRGTRVLTPQAQAHVRAHAGKAFTLSISTPREPVPIFQGRVQGFTPPGSLPSHSRLRSLLWAPIAPLLPWVPARLTLAHLPAPSDCEPLKGWPGLLDLGASVPGRGVSGKIS